MKTEYSSQVNYLSDGLTELSIKAISIQVFDEEMCERFIERIKKEITNARQETEKLKEDDDFKGRLIKTYQSSTLHRLKRENPFPCQNLVGGFVENQNLNPLSHNSEHELKEKIEEVVQELGLI